MIGHDFPYLDTRDLNLDWLLRNMKQLLQDWATYQQTMNRNFANLQAAVNQFETDITTAFDNLHDYVEDYFDNLDVQQEINNKLDDMKQSGELAVIMNPLIATEAGNWLSTHITNPSNPPIDTSLSVSGAAADAKVTGDKITELKNALDDTDYALMQKGTEFYLSTSHSSSADKVFINVNSGETYYAVVKTAGSGTVSGALIGWKSDNSSENLGGVASDNTYEKTAAADYVAFSLYLNQPEAPDTVIFRIIKKGSALLAQYNIDHLRNFAIGKLDSPIILDNVNRTIQVPAGIFYPSAFEHYKLIPAMAATSFASKSDWILCVDYATSQYKLLPYDGTRNYEYSVIMAFSSSNTVNFTTPFPVLIDGKYREGAEALTLINNINTNLLSSGESSWTQSGSHSSTLNKALINISNGDDFYFIARTSTGENLTGQLQSYDSGNTGAAVGTVITNRLYKFTASRDIVSFGLYLPAPANPCDVVMSIVRADTFLNMSMDIDGVPSYWKNTLDTAINTVADLQTYQSGLTFGFITDIHWETNYQISPALIDYINRHSRVDLWLNGGDTASGDGSDGTQQIEWLYEAMGSYGHGYKFYSVNGNHDPNQGGTLLDNATLKNLIMPYYNDVTFGNGLYYWFDYRDTRFVCLDTNAAGAGEVDATQIAWAANVIQNSTLPVIICMHIVFLTGTAAGENDPCAFFNALITAIGTNANVKMIIGGHIHNDKAFIASNGTPVVLLDTDSRFADDGINRVQGTTSEQCLSIVTNDYTSKLITVTRIGSIKQSFTLSYA